MKYVFPVAGLISGVVCILMGQALAGTFLCFCSAILYNDCLEGDKG
jgi:hypothetical protein